MSYGSSGGDMVVGLRLDDQLSPGLQAAANNVIAFTGSVERSLGALSRLGAAAAPLAALGIGLKAGVSAAGDLQQQIANLNAVLAATPAQMQKITASSLELSRQTQFTAAQIIQAQAQLAKAGSSPADIGATSKNVLNLASATFSDPTAAAKAYIAAQKDFQLGNDQSKQTVDTLAQAVDSSTLSLAQYQTAFKQLGPVAAANNENLKDTATVIADLSKAGLTGDAGTALKTFIQRIVTETPQAAAEIKKLGLSFFDAGGNLKSYADIFDEIRLKTSGLSEEQAQQALGTIFGTRGIRVADIAMQEGSTGLADTAQHMAEIGSAADIASKKLDTFQGQAHILASSLNVLAVQGGNAVLPMFTSIEQGVTGVVNKISQLNGVGGGVLPQLLIGGGAIFGANKLFDGINARAAAPGIAQSAQDQALLDGYMAKEQARYQTELKNYETYQSKLAAFQDQEAARLAESNAKIEALTLGHQAKLAAIQEENIYTPITGAKQLEAQNAAFAKQVEASTFVGGKAPVAIEKPVPIALPVDLEPVIDKQSLAQKLSGLVEGGFAGALQRVSIAFLVKDLIIDPLNNAVTTAEANRFTPQTFDKQAFGTGTQPGQAATVYASDLTALDQYVSQKKAKLQEITDYQKSWAGWIAGATDSGSSSSKEAQNVQQDLASTEAARQRILAAQQTSPDQAFNDQATRLQTLAGQVGSGKMSIDQAMSAFGNVVTDGGTRDAQVESLTQHLQDMGVSQEKINDLVAQAKPLFDQEIQQYYDSQAATDAANKTLQTRQDLLRSLGVSQTSIDNEASGGKTGLAAKKTNDSIIKQDTEGAKQLKDALSLAAQGYDTLQKSVGKLAPEKGIPDLLKNLDALKAAQADLTVNGDGNKSLNDLIAIGDSFKQLTDEENKARAGYDAFLLGVSHTQSYNKEIDSFKQELTSLDQYLTNKPKSAITQDDTTYLQNKSKLLAQLNDQQDQLFESELKQVNALQAGGQLPDFAEMNAKWQAQMTALGGGPAVQLKLEMDTTDALRSSKNVMSVMDALTHDPHHIRMLLDNYPTVQADIDAANGDISKLTEHDWQVILETTVGDKSGLDAIDAFNRAQGAHAQATIDIIYNSPATKQELLTTNDYQDVAHRVQTQVYQAQNQTVAVGVGANTQDFDSKMGALEHQTYATTISVNADTSSVEAKIRALSGMTINVGVNYGADNTPSAPPVSSGQRNFAYGGTTNGRYAIVGDGKDGNMRYAEVVDFASKRVIDHDTAAHMGLLGNDLPRYAGGTDTIAIDDYSGGPYNPDFPGPVGDLSKKITGGKGSGKGVGAARKSVQGIKQDLLDATTALNDFAGSLDGLSAKEVESVTQNFDKLYATLKSFNEGQLPKSATQGQKDAADSSALNQSLANATAWAQAMYDIDHNASNVKADVQAIADTGGPIGQNMAAQVVLMGQMAQVSKQIKDDQSALKDLETAHAATVRQRSDADKTTQRDRQTLSTQEQIAATNAERAQTQSDWRLQDRREQATKDHQATLDNIQSASDAENDTWTITQRNEQDATRALQQRGTLQQRQIQDEQTALERAHRDALGRNSANEQLLAAQSMAATSAGTSNIAGLQLAISKYNDKLSLQDYQKQLDTVQDAIKDQARLASDAAFDLQTEQIAAQRAHENTMQQLSEASKAENQRWQGVQLGYQVQDKAITRTRTLEQWAEQDRQRNEQLTYAAIDQYVADQRQTEDDAYNKSKTQLTDRITDNQSILTGLGNDLTALKDIETTWEKLYPIVGNAANVLLNFGQQIMATAGQNVSADPGYHTVGGRRLGNALGTDYWIGGPTTLGEHGVEAVLAPGSKVLSNASIRALVNSLANPTPNIGGGGGGNTFHFNINGASAPDEEAQAKIEAFVVAQIAESAQRAQRRQSSRPTGAMR